MTYVRVMLHKLIILNCRTGSFALITIRVLVNNSALLLSPATGHRNWSLETTKSTMNANLNRKRSSMTNFTYVAIFLSSWTLNKYSTREKFQLISWTEGKDMFKLRGIGLSKELDIHASGKLLAAKFWNRCGNKSWTIFINVLAKSIWISLSKKNAEKALIGLAWWPCSCSDDNQEN